MNKPGFTIIELLFSIMIASFLIMTLTTVLDQTNRARNFAQIQVHTALLKNALINMLHQDFAGIFFPQVRLRQDSDGQAKKDENKDSDQQGKTAASEKDEEVPPIIIKRNAENMVEEIRFTTVSASTYRNLPIPTEVIYSLVSTDKAKKMYKIQRKMLVKNEDQSKQKESEPITFLENIIGCTAQLVSVSRLRQDAGEQSAKVAASEQKKGFELIDNWPILRQDSGGQASNEKMTEKKNQQKNDSEKKEEKIEIPYIKITIVYLANKKGAEESFTVYIPLFITKKDSSFVKTPEDKPAEKKNENPPKPETKQQTDKQKPAALVAEKRASKALNSIFGGIK